LLVEWDVSDKLCWENQFSSLSFSPQNRIFYEISEKNVMRSREATHDNTIRRIRVAWWVTKATQPHSEHGYCLFTTKMHERVWILSLYCVVCLSICSLSSSIHLCTTQQGTSQAAVMSRPWSPPTLFVVDWSDVTFAAHLCCSVNMHIISLLINTLVHVSNKWFSTDRLK
jgi:hypothetical protein